MLRVGEYDFFPSNPKEGVKPYKGQVKCTLVEALRLCPGCLALRGGRSIVLPFHDQGIRRE
jgi:hypothetical protein